MKRLVILSAFLTPFRSGAEACAEEVAACLQNDFDITIVTARLHKNLPHLDRLPSGVRVWRVGIGSSIDKWLFPFLAPRAAEALKPDIIHAVLETFAGLALMRCTNSNARRILTLQTTNRSFLKGPIVRSPDVVTAISSALVKIANELGRKDVTLIPNGVNIKLINDVRAKHGKVEGRILFVGRLEQMKGVDTLIRAFAQLLINIGYKIPACACGLRTGRQDTRYRQDPESKIEGVNLRIVGDGSQRVDLEKLSHELGISDRVTFTGFLNPFEAASEFAQAQIFCGLSRSEALGNVFLEAQAAGCAVIGTNVGGIPDSIKDGQTGLLVEPDDADAAAKALEKLLTDKALMQKLAAAGEKNAQNYDWKAIAERYRQVYLTQ